MLDFVVLFDLTIFTKCECMRCKNWISFRDSLKKIPSTKKKSGVKEVGNFCIGSRELDNISMLLRAYSKFWPIASDVYLI